MDLTHTIAQGSSCEASDPIDSSASRRSIHTCRSRPSAGFQQSRSPRHSYSSTRTSIE